MSKGVLKIYVKNLLELKDICYKMLESKSTNRGAEKELELIFDNDFIFLTSKNLLAIIQVYKLLYIFF